MLLFENVYKSYGHRQALDNFNLRIHDGALFGLIGPNGAGKTTVITLLAGLILPDQGTIRIDDMDAGDRIRRLRKRIGYVPAESGMIPNLKVFEYMSFFANCYDLSGAKVYRRMQQLLDTVGLLDRGNQYVDTLSPGQQKKLSLARALLQDPKYLLLDEPLAGLDPQNSYDFRQVIANMADSGKTIVITSHVLSDIADLCTDVGIMDKGKIVLEGEMDTVLEEVNQSNPIIISMESGMAPAVRILRDNPCVKSVSIRNREVLIGFNGTSDDETALLRSLVEKGIPVRSFHREKGNFEAVFMKLTGNEERRVTSYEAESDLSEG